MLLDIVSHRTVQQPGSEPLIRCRGTTSLPASTAQHPHRSSSHGAEPTVVKVMEELPGPPGTGDGDCGCRRSGEPPLTWGFGSRWASHRGHWSSRALGVPTVGVGLGRALTEAHPHLK